MERNLEKLNMEYQDVKAQNDQMMKIVSEVVDSKADLSNADLIQELRDIIKACKDNMKNQAVKNDDLLMTLRREVEECRQNGFEKDKNIEALSLQLQESKTKLSEMNDILLDATKSINCEDVKRRLYEKETEVDRIREELESLNSQNENLMRKLAQKSPGLDCSMYIRQISSLQKECVEKLDEQVELNREMNEAQNEELRIIQYLLEEMKDENEKLINANRGLKSKLKDCEEATNEIELDILKLENSKLQVENDQLMDKVRLCKYEEEQEVREFQDQLFYEIDEKVKEKDKVKSVKYKNNQLKNLSKNLIDQNDELLRRIQFYAEHLCELCSVDDEQKQEMIDDMILLQNYGEKAKIDFESIA